MPGQGDTICVRVQTAVNWKSTMRGLIVCSACIGGEVPKKIINDQLEEAEEAVRWYKNLFGDD